MRIQTLFQFLYVGVIFPLTLVACNSGVKFSNSNLESAGSSTSFEPPVISPLPPAEVELPPPPPPSPPSVPSPVEPPVVVTPPPVPTPPVPTPPTPPAPPEPPVVVTPPVITPPPGPTYQYTHGNCADDSSTSITGCMTCQIPEVPVVTEPNLSLKAQQLLEIMALSCPIQNKSQPRHYVAPTRAHLLEMLHKCSPAAYQDTIPSAEQTQVLRQLLDSQNPSLREKMFKSLWYQSPQHESFETYFGLEINEAVQIMCYRDYNVMSVHQLFGPLWPVDYGDVRNPWDYELPPAYKLANEQIRPELYACMRSSLAQPYSSTPSEIQKKSCRYETMSGPLGDPIKEQVLTWLNLNFKVGMEISEQGLCAEVTHVDQLKGFKDHILVGAYICQ